MLSLLSQIPSKSFDQTLLGKKKNFNRINYLKGLGEKKKVNQFQRLGYFLIVPAVTVRYRIYLFTESSDKINSIISAASNNQFRSKVKLKRNRDPYQEISNLGPICIHSEKKTNFYN